MTKSANELVGKCFVIWGANKQFNYQGQIIGNPEPGFYLVQFFEALLGEPSTLAVYHIDAMLTRTRRGEGTFEFFENAAHLRDWAENVYRAPRSSEED